MHALGSSAPAAPLSNNATVSVGFGVVPHQMKTALANWFRRRSFAALNSSVRFSPWVEQRLNRALFGPDEYVLVRCGFPRDH